MASFKSQEILQKKLNKNLALSGKSLGFLGVDHKIRQFSARVILSPKFEYFILILIIFSSMLLTLEGPYLDPNGDLSQKLK